MIQKFLDKCYSTALIEETFQFYHNDNPDKKSPPDNTQPVQFVTQFDCQQRKMERIFKRHWSIFLEDTHLTSTITELLKVAPT